MAVTNYGSYKNAFTQRNINERSSIILDNSDYIRANSINPNRAIEAGAGITMATVIEGFSINGSTRATADYTSAILTHGGASPTIQNNTLNGGSGSMYSQGLVNIQSSAPHVIFNIINGGNGNYESRGINNNTSSPLITANTIIGGTGTTSTGVYSSNNSAAVISDNQINGGNSSFSYAIYTESSSPTVFNNTIHGGVGFNSSYGIYHFSSLSNIYNNIIFGGESNIVSYGISINNGSSYIRNNSIDGGNGLIAYGLFFKTNSTHIDNNIIFTSGGSGAAYCLSEGSASSAPVTLRNNNLYHCATALYVDYIENANCSDGAMCLASITDVNILASSNASNNISTDPLFIDIDGADNNISSLTDNNWRYSLLSPSIMTQGGLNGVDEGDWGFSDDKDHQNRPSSASPWSIGAYEP